MYSTTVYRAVWCSLQCENFFLAMVPMMPNILRDANIQIGNAPSKYTSSSSFFLASTLGELPVNIDTGQ